MIRTGSLLCVTVFCGIALAQQAHPIDDAALKDAGRIGDEWISYNGNWSEQRYSPLNQINASNVSRLGLAWSYDAGQGGGNQQPAGQAAH